MLKPAALLDCKLGTGEQIIGHTANVMSSRAPAISQVNGCGLLSGKWVLGLSSQKRVRCLIAQQLRGLPHEFSRFRQRLR